MGVPWGWYGVEMDHMGYRGIGIVGEMSGRCLVVIVE